METVNSLLAKVANNLEKIHVAGVAEQKLMINSIEILRKLSEIVQVNITEVENAHDERESGDV